MKPDVPDRKFTNFLIVIRVVDHLLCKGAKLLPEEETKFLAKPKNSPEHEVAVRQQSTDPYNPTDYLA